MKDWNAETIASARQWNDRGTGSMAEKTRAYGLALDEIVRLRSRLGLIAELSQAGGRSPQHKEG